MKFWVELSFLAKLRLFFVIILLSLMAIILYFKIIPFGQITYERHWPTVLRSGKGFIYDFKPQERVTDDGQSLIIKADPVYFSLFTPRRFDRAKVTIKYYNHLTAATPIIELGLLQDKISGAYNLQPLQNNILDSLRFSWPRLEDSDQRLILQAGKYYSEVADFESDLAAGHLRNCPAGPTSCVAVYNYHLSSDYGVPDYVRLTPFSLSHPLRGSHQFYVYLKKNLWRLDLSFINENKDRVADPIIVNVYDDGKIIATQTIVDDNLNPTGVASEEKKMSLSGTVLHDGVYKVEIKISDDVIISSLQIPSDRLSFVNKIWPASAGALTLFTDASYIQARTLDPVNLGNINFGGQDFNLSEAYQQFTFATGEPGIKELQLSKDDITLANNGVFAFSRAGLFNPAPSKVDRFFVEGGEAKYIIANYDRPINQDGLKTASAEFDMSAASYEKGKYTFLISVPGLEWASDSDTVDTFLDIKEISVELNGKTLWQKIWR